jgi:hypothetical protein
MKYNTASYVWKHLNSQECLILTFIKQDIICTYKNNIIRGLHDLDTGIRGHTTLSRTQTDSLHLGIRALADYSWIQHCRDIFQ